MTRETTPSSPSSYPRCRSADKAIHRLCTGRRPVLEKKLEDCTVSGQQVSLQTEEAIGYNSLCFAEKA